MSQKCEQFSYELFFVIFVIWWILGPKWSPPPPPHPHPRRQCQSSLPGEKILKKTVFDQKCIQLRTCKILPESVPGTYSSRPIYFLYFMFTYWSNGRGVGLHQRVMIEPGWWHLDLGAFLSGVALRPSSSRSTVTVDLRCWTNYSIGIATTGHITFTINGVPNRGTFELGKAERWSKNPKSGKLQFQKMMVAKWNSDIITQETTYAQKKQM